MSSNLVCNHTRDKQIVRFCYHSYDYRPNWTPLSPIIITNQEICCSKTFISRVFKNIYCRVLSAANLIVVISMVDRSHGFLGRSSLYANLGLKVEFSHGSVHD